MAANGFIYRKKKPVWSCWIYFSTKCWKPRENPSTDGRDPLLHLIQVLTPRHCLTEKLELVSFTRGASLRYDHKPHECKNGGARLTKLPKLPDLWHNRLVYVHRMSQRWQFTLD